MTEQTLQAASLGTRFPDIPDPREQLERSYYTHTHDLLTIASSFIDFNVRNPQTNTYAEPKLFVHDFVAAAHELGHAIEHTEALALLEASRKQQEDEYKAHLRSEVERAFDEAWLRQVPFEAEKVPGALNNVAAFITLYQRGDCQEYIQGRFNDLVNICRVNADYDHVDPIFHLCDRAMNEYVPARVANLIVAYQQDPAAFIARARTITIEIQGEQA